MKTTLTTVKMHPAPSKLKHLLFITITCSLLTACNTSEDYWRSELTAAAYQLTDALVAAQQEADAQNSGDSD